MRKKLELQRIEPLVRGLAAVVLLLGFAIIIRLDDVEASALGGFLLFFFLFGTVEYYYVVACVLVLLWYRREDERAGALFLGLLFVLVYLGIDTGFWRDGRRVLSRLVGRDAKLTARRPAVEALAVSVALAVLPATLWFWWTQFGA
jgi:hypothetical protein